MRKSSGRWGSSHSLSRAAGARGSTNSGATVVEWSATCVRYQVSTSDRKTVGSKPGHEYELFLVSRCELALIAGRTCILSTDVQTETEFYPGSPHIANGVVCNVFEEGRCASLTNFFVGAMAEEHLSLKWNNHQAHFVDILTFLREKGMFVDVTLACGGKVYSAHKFVLSTCSDYFQKIFSKNTSANPVVFMKDVSCNDIEALLDFMYHGEVNVPQSSLGSLIKTAEGLQIKGLAVPDDPPSRKKQDRDKRERDPSSSSHYESRSPPPKRRSRNSPPRRNSARAIPPPVETYLDNNDADDVALRNSPPTINSHDARNSSEASSSNKKAQVANDSSEEHSVDGKGACDKELSGDSNNETPQLPNCDGAAEHEDSAGPSGLRQSKQEEMEIKQEDVVELGEDDDDGVDWGGGMGDDGGGGSAANNDGLNSGDNSVSFSDVLLPPPDQGGGGGIMDGAGTGDSAMLMSFAGRGEGVLSPFWASLHASSSPPSSFFPLAAAMTPSLMPQMSSGSNSVGTAPFFGSSSTRRVRQAEVRGLRGIRPYRRPGSSDNVSTSYQKYSSTFVAAGAIPSQAFCTDSSSEVALNSILSSTALAAKSAYVVANRSCSATSELMNNIGSNTLPYENSSLLDCNDATARISTSFVDSRKQNEWRPFSCSFCDKRFKRKDHVRDHERLHTGERPYAQRRPVPRSASLSDVDASLNSLPAWPSNVVILGKEPYNSRELGAPVKTSFLCRFCNKGFERRDNCIRHEKVHTGDRPFLCPLCPKRFITKANLQYHLYRSQEHASYYNAGSADETSNVTYTSS
ncbi:BTB/POZ domain [Trinorchestia longiramus]|nr:BTB/POZ domain [Trinorchestia longiramus]